MPCGDSSLPGIAGGYRDLVGELKRMDRTPAKVFPFQSDAVYGGLAVCGGLVLVATLTGQLWLSIPAALVGSFLALRLPVWRTNGRIELIDGELRVFDLRGKLVAQGRLEEIEKIRIFATDDGPPWYDVYFETGVVRLHNRYARFRDLIKIFQGQLEANRQRALDEGRPVKELRP